MCKVTKNSIQNKTQPFFLGNIDPLGALTSTKKVAFLTKNNLRTNKLQCPKYIVERERINLCCYLRPPPRVAPAPLLRVAPALLREDGAAALLLDEEDEVLPREELRTLLLLREPAF